jgi:hypothetical protein
VPSPEGDIDQASDSEGEDDVEVLGDFLSGRLENSTRMNYQSGIRSVKRLLQLSGNDGPDAIQNGALVIPMSANVWKAWLAEAKKPLDETGKLRAPSTVFGFVNAVKYLYTEKSEKISEEVLILIKKYEEAYKRNVSKLRQKGIMAAQEGKHYISMNAYAKLCKLALYSSEYRRMR